MFRVCFIILRRRRRRPEYTEKDQPGHPRRKLKPWPRGKSGKHQK